MTAATWTILLSSLGLLALGGHHAGRLTLRPFYALAGATVATCALAIVGTRAFVGILGYGFAVVLVAAVLVIIFATEVDDWLAEHQMHRYRREVRRRR